MENTEWYFSLYFAGYDTENYIAYYLYRAEDDGPVSIEIDYMFEILGSDGSVLEEMHETKHEFPKAYIWGWSENLERTRVFQFEKHHLLPLNTLTVRCRMRRCENRRQERLPRQCRKRIKNKRAKLKNYSKYRAPKAATSEISISRRPFPVQSPYLYRKNIA
ncbi:hypothetical protein TNIN_324991 [Trichonephila inaurata madagascariensis]|uniref:Uncharacterized protein n=1 Tax=Trichonephila inaurata madagascariensis TaxID=2747483 RepID=A0A8X7BU14_9ARAC|nr:hypothetical protein TNIN_324991 [Trichonephila inaurata madagascariensis]